MSASSSRRGGKILACYRAPPEHFARLAQIAATYELVRAETVEQACSEARDAEVFLGNRCFLQALPFAENLRWMQSNSAGMDVILADPLARRRSFVLTAARGIYDEEMADHALALVYACLRELPSAWRDATAGRWERRPLRHLAGRRALVFGFGGVGQAIARRLLAARAEVVVVRRTPRAPALRERELAAPSVDLAAGRDLLSTVDIAVLALPLTPETRGCFDAEALRRLRDGCILVNVARGALLDESSLEAHVARLGGVGLDVFETEPLPSEHWLWRHPKVIVTAHVARSPDAGAPAWLGLVEQNLAAYVAGAPLLHVVDKERGY